LIDAVRAVGEQANDSLAEAPGSRPETVKFVPSERFTVNGPADPVPAFWIVNPLGPTAEAVRLGVGGQTGTAKLAPPAPA
jgi:hypothetical protein